MKRTLLRRICTVFMSAVLLFAYTPIPANAAETDGGTGKIYSETGELLINETTFPDEAFRNCIKESDVDQNGSLSKEEIRGLYSLDIDSKGIRDLSGVEYLTDLTNLNCSGNQLTALDVSQNKFLMKLNCSDNQLTELDVTKNPNLTRLYCYENGLTELNLANNSQLMEIRCNKNQITALDISHMDQLTYLECFENQLTELKLAQNAKLEVLKCYKNKIQELDLTGLAGLEFLQCSENQLIRLEPTDSPSLYQLDCAHNQLTVLDVSRNTLLGKGGDANRLICNDNALASLDISNNPLLTGVYCQDNELTDLKLQGAGVLKYLHCYNNKLTSLDVSDNTALSNLDCSNNALTSLDVSNNTALSNLNCSNNALTSLDVSNTKVTESKFSCDGNSYNLGTVKSLDIHTLPGNPDIMKIKTLSGADWAPATGMLTNFSSDERIVYTYDAGKNLTVTFVLSYSTHEHHMTDHICDICGAVEIQEAVFPDEVFRTDIAKRQDKDRDGILSKGELIGSKEMDIKGLGIADLTGIQHFKALTKLECSNNPLTGLDVSRNTNLEELTCAGDQLTVLDVSQNANLLNLNCSNNPLTGLDVSRNTNLEELTCAEDQLTVLDVSQNANLLYLDCYNNQLTGLDVSQNANLLALDCSVNQLTGLDVSQNANLLGLYCDSNRLTGLDMSGNTNLEELSCFGNQLTVLDVSRNAALVYLYCDSNRLTGLDMSGNTNLEELTCAGNQLTSLDVSQNAALVYLECSNNRLTSLDVSGNTNLERLLCAGNQLTSLDVSGNTYLGELTCARNQLTSLDISGLSIYAGYYTKNIYDIGSDITSFDLSRLPGNFDVTKAKDWNGATCTDGKLTDLSGNGIITYTYDVGGKQPVTFTLLYTNHKHGFKDHICETCGALEIHTEIFPDESFRNYILESFDKNQDNALSGSEREAVTAIYIASLGITDLTGIEYFTALKELECRNNKLTALDVSKNTELDYLACAGNQLTSLDLSGNESIWQCYAENNSYFIGCGLTSFDLSRLPGNFDVTKAGDWNGATCTDGKLTNLSGNGIITYTYDTGGEQPITFTLVYSEHIYSQKNTDEKYLKTPASCTEAARYYYSCENCGEAGTETFTAGEPKGHTWDEGRVTKLPTRTEEGMTTYSCKDCDAVKTESIAKAEGVTEIEVAVGEKVFPARLYDNAAAKALEGKLPLTLDMQELNGNEKYYEFTDKFSSIDAQPAAIQAGDIMLYNSNTLVLFYEGYQPVSYSYTPLGYVEDAAGLAEALGKGEVTVTIRLKEEPGPGPGPGPEPDKTVYWGDVDGDGRITPDDALFILMSLAGKQPITDEMGRVLADCDGKTGISPDDALFILEILAGKRDLKIYDGSDINETEEGKNGIYEKKDMEKAMHSFYVGGSSGFLCAVPGWSGRDRT